MFILNLINFFQATDFSYLVLTRNQIEGRNARNSDLECDRLHGTIKLTGMATYAIENCGDCDCHLLIKKIEDGAFHLTYDESDLTTDDTQLPNEVFELFNRVDKQHFMPDLEFFLGRLSDVFLNS